MRAENWKCRILGGRVVYIEVALGGSVRAPLPVGVAISGIDRAVYVGGAVNLAPLWQVLSLIAQRHIRWYPIRQGAKFTNRVA